MVVAVSTIFRSNKDHSRPTKTQVKQGLRSGPPKHPLASVGLHKPRLWHKNDTNLPQVIFADNHTTDYGTENCRRMRRHIFSDLSLIAGDLASHYVKTAERFNYEQANHKLLDIHNSLLINDLNLCADNDDLLCKAKRYAKKCEVMRYRSKTPQEAYQACTRIVEYYCIPQPVIKDHDLEPALNRMCCSRWWYKKIQTLKLRTLETISRNIELVSRYKASYVSDFTIKMKRKQKEKTREYLSSTFVCNENGDKFSLQDLANRSVSNPAIRRAELMIRVKGFEMVASQVGHVGEFYTLTTPSRMHACLHNGKPNPRFDGTTIQEAQEYLAHNWGLIRAEFHRRGIQPYGFRVVEPHHDGTPHWHLLLFMPDKHREAARQIMRYYALLDNGNEAGAQTHRFKAIAIDPEKGTAAGYIAKYIAKNIDGYALDQDSYGNDAHKAAERITSWANTWGIRQFQQIGGPSVTVWRQLRKLYRTNNIELEVARRSAAASDWAAFMLAMGSPESPRHAQPIKPLYERNEQIDSTTGEILPARNRYGEAASPRVVGININGRVYSTKNHNWMLLTPDSEDVTSRSTAPAVRESCHATAVSLGPVSITVPNPIYHQESAHEHSTMH